MATRDFKDYVWRTLEHFRDDPTEYELPFPDTLTSDQRAQVCTSSIIPQINNTAPQIHIAASRLGLKRASRGDEANGTRFITVYKPNVRASNKPFNVFTRSMTQLLLSKSLIYLQLGRKEISLQVKQW